MTPASRIAVVLESGARRTFASAIDWPGWSRGGRDEESALAALGEYERRYRSAVASARSRPAMPRGASLEVVERVQGNATTDFGAPGVAARADDRPLRLSDTRRLIRLLRSTWAAFDGTAAAARGVSLRAGPRGGGRPLSAIVDHVRDAEGAYLSKIGGPTKAPRDVEELRALVVQILSARAAGEPPPRMPRSGGVWPVRYAIRRSAWHALDHAWEIEDRSS